MFELLTDLTDDDAIGAVYFAVRVLKEAGGRGTAANSDVRVADAASEPTNQQMLIGNKIIKAIEEAESESVLALNSKQVAKYLRQLYKVADRHSGGRLANVKEADQILREFRREAASMAVSRGSTIIPVKRGRPRKASA
jgi:hypothetical protein